MFCSTLFAIVAAQMRRFGPVENVLRATINLGMIKILFNRDASLYFGFHCQAFSFVLLKMWLHTGLFSQLMLATYTLKSNVW